MWDLVDNGILHAVMSADARTNGTVHSAFKVSQSESWKGDRGAQEPPTIGDEANSIHARDPRSRRAHWLDNHVRCQTCEPHVIKAVQCRATPC